MEIKMRIWTQVLGALAASLTAAATGSAVSFSAILIHQLKDDEDIPLDINEASWIPTIFMLNSMISCCLGGWFSNIYGRRICIITWQSVAFICCVVTYFASDKWMLFAARGTIGFATGMSFSSVGIYVSETVHKSLRNAVGCLPSTFLAIGMLSNFIMGYFLHWRMCALLSTTLPALSVVLMIVIPESPYWLVEQGRDEDAKKSLLFYREHGFENELQDIISQNSDVKAKSKGQTTSNFAHTWQTLKSQAFLKPLSCVGVLYGVCQFAGIPILIMYMPGIFEETGANMDPVLASVVVMSVRLVAAGLASFTIHHIPKKVVFVACSWCLALSLLTLILYDVLKTSPEFKDLLEHHNWIPVGAIVVAMSSHALGIINVLHILVAEAFPTEIRSICAGFLKAFSNAMHVLAVKMYPNLLDFVGFPFAFGIYAGMAFFLGLWGLLKIEHNDGLSLTDIERRLDKKIDEDHQIRK